MSLGLPGYFRSLIPRVQPVTVPAEQRLPNAAIGMLLHVPGGSAAMRGGIHRWPGHPAGERGSGEPGSGFPGQPGLGEAGSGATARSARPGREHPIPPCPGGSGRALSGGDSAHPGEQTSDPAGTPRLGTPAELWGVEHHLVQGCTAPVRVLPGEAAPGHEWSTHRPGPAGAPLHREFVCPADG